MELDIPSISAIVAAVGVLVGVAIAVVELRNLVKQRQTDLIMRLYQAWGTEEYKKGFGTFLGLEIKDFDSFSKKYGSLTSPERSPLWTDIDRYTWFFNGIGYLVYHKLADIEQVEDLFGSGVIAVWEKTKPLIEGWRKQLNLPKSNRWLEYLSNEMKKREQQVGVKNG